MAAQYPGNIGDQILKAAAQAFTDGKSAAMTVALVLSILGLLLVVFLFPKRVEEEAYYTKIAATK